MSTAYPQGEPLVELAFGGCTTHEDDRTEARRGLHDQLIKACPIRLGPIEWRHYPPGEAPGFLEQAGLTDDPNARGLLAFLETTPDAELVVASVEIPQPAPAGWRYEIPRVGTSGSRCRSCEAPVIWATHETSGKRAPFNPDGVNHFATCPQAHTWRKRP